MIHYKIKVSDMHEAHDIWKPYYYCISAFTTMKLSQQMKHHSCKISTKIILVKICRKFKNSSNMIGKKKRKAEDKKSNYNLL